MEAPANHPALLGALLMQQFQTRLLKLSLGTLTLPCGGHLAVNSSTPQADLDSDYMREQREGHWKYCKGLDHSTEN